MSSERVFWDVPAWTLASPPSPVASMFALVFQFLFRLASPASLISLAFLAFLEEVSPISLFSLLISLLISLVSLVVLVASQNIETCAAHRHGHWRVAVRGGHSPDLVGSGGRCCELDRSGMNYKVQVGTTYSTY